MMDWRFAHEAIFRWVHVVAGIMWIGHLYFFNFVNGPFAATLEADTRRKVVPQLVPRALYWFRWGAAWTWVTGVLLLFLVFWWSDPAFYTGPSIVMILVTFLAFALYDALFKMDFAKDLRVGGAVGLGLVIVIVAGGYVAWAGFGYRAYVIHTGALFGTIMAANVWMRIWPLQKKIITAVRDGAAPDPAWAPLHARLVAGPSPRSCGRARELRRPPQRRPSPPCAPCPRRGRMPEGGVPRPRVAGRGRRHAAARVRACEDADASRRPPFPRR